MLYRYLHGLCSTPVETDLVQDHNNFCLLLLRMLSMLLTCSKSLSYLVLVYCLQVGLYHQAKSNINKIQRGKGGKIFALKAPKH